MRVTAHDLQERGRELESLARQIATCGVALDDIRTRPNVRHREELDEALRTTRDLLAREIVALIGSPN